MADALTARLVYPPGPKTVGVFEVATATARDVYPFAEGPEPSPGGRLFEVLSYRPRDAFTGDVARYHVLVMRPVEGGQAHGQCTCPDGTYRDRPCKHVRGLFQLMAREEI